MRIAEYKQTGTHTEPRTIHHAEEMDEMGNIITEAFDEVQEVEVPTMGLVYRDMTEAEEAEAKAEAERIEAEMATMPKSTEERLDECEDTADMAYINSELALALLDAE